MKTDNTIQCDICGKSVEVPKDFIHFDRLKHRSGKWYVCGMPTRNRDVCKDCMKAIKEFVNNRELFVHPKNTCEIKYMLVWKGINGEDKEKWVYDSSEEAIVDAGKTMRTVVGWIENHRGYYIVPILRGKKNE